METQDNTFCHESHGISLYLSICCSHCALEGCNGAVDAAMAEAIGEAATQHHTTTSDFSYVLCILMSFVKFVSCLHSLHCKSLPQVLAEGSTWMRDGTLLAVRTELQHDFTFLSVFHLFSSFDFFSILSSLF